MHGRKWLAKSQEACKAKPKVNRQQDSEPRKIRGIEKEIVKGIPQKLGDGLQFAGEGWEQRVELESHVQKLLARPSFGWVAVHQVVA